MVRDSHELACFGVFCMHVYVNALLLQLQVFDKEENKQLKEGEEIVSVTAVQKIELHVA